MDEAAYLIRLIEDFADSRGYRFGPGSRQVIAAGALRLSGLLQLPLDERLELFDKVFDEIDRENGIARGSAARGSIELHEWNVPKASQAVAGRILSGGLRGFAPSSASIIRDSCPWC